tara:strand:+ start:734 stop:1864 length:1131 start_codon:yes stop_codon:yes gene_type:complete
MMKKIKQGMFPFLIGFAALSVSASAAFYSVSGLSKLFAGASLEVIIMASSLEFAKLITASLLYQYWSVLNKSLRVYLSIATLILILITSMGIYGFLSSAYQGTFRQLTLKENQTKFLTQKKDFYEGDVIRYDKELQIISGNISTLSNAKATSIQVKDRSVEGGIRNTISTSELRLSQQRIKVEEENRKGIQSKREKAADSLQKYQLKILELDNNTDVAGELGPLLYLSNLTDIPMDKIINILLLVIIFVFDPLAISLVIASNFAFEQAYPKKNYKENLYGEDVEDVDDFSVWDHTLYDGLEEEEIKVEEKKEYNILDLNQDNIISTEEVSKLKQRLYDLQRQLEQNQSYLQNKKLKDQIQQIKDKISQKDDETKIY